MPRHKEGVRDNIAKCHMRERGFTVKLQVEYPFDLSALLPLYDLVWQPGNPDRGRQPNC